ncbi:unnamed protein product, partial [Vitis vinifera]|uniref:Uncharacterized protein n=1 Tax=Vitis vinifera TaxID=29760 RepID=D7TKP1_VITVI
MFESWLSKMEKINSIPSITSLVVFKLFTICCAVAVALFSPPNRCNKYTYISMRSTTDHIWDITFWQAPILTQFCQQFLIS